MGNSNLKHNSIEKYLITRIPAITENATVKDALSMLEKKSNIYDSVDYIYTIDKNKNLTGMFSVQELFNNPKDTPIKEFIQKAETISLNTEIEQAAHIALKHKLKQIPVTKSKKLIGVVSSREILSVINKSLRQDIFHFAGIHKSHLEFDNSLEIPMLKALKAHLSWLIIGFIGAMFMASYIRLFEDTLAKYLIIASFMPAIVYISDALGTQFQTVFVRDLAILGKSLDLKKYFSKQITLGFLIALLISLLMFFFISVVWNVPHTAYVISLAAFATLIVTTLSALFTTFLIKRFKFDPALGSGPVATIISDITSVVIYFIIVVLLI